MIVNFSDLRQFAPQWAENSLIKGYLNCVHKTEHNYSGSSMTSCNRRELIICNDVCTLYTILLFEQLFRFIILRIWIFAHGGPLRYKLKIVRALEVECWTKHAVKINDGREQFPECNERRAWHEQPRSWWETNTIFFSLDQEKNIHWFLHYQNSDIDN